MYPTLKADASRTQASKFHPFKLQAQLVNLSWTSPIVAPPAYASYYAFSLKGDFVIRFLLPLNHAAPPCSGPVATLELDVEFSMPFFDDPFWPVNLAKAFVLVRDLRPFNKHISSTRFVVVFLGGDIAITFFPIGSRVSRTALRSRVAEQRALTWYYRQQWQHNMI